MFRIDHYLGKESVQNLLFFRFANSFLRPSGTATSRGRVEITMAEAFGVETRGKFFEEVGAIRDVVQNHLLQVVAQLAIGAPVGHDPSALLKQKAKVFKAIRTLAESRARSVRAVQRGRRRRRFGCQDLCRRPVAPRLVALGRRTFYLRAGKELARDDHRGLRHAQTSAATGLRRHAARRAELPAFPAGSGSRRDRARRARRRTPAQK